MCRRSWILTLGLLAAPAVMALPTRPLATDAAPEALAAAPPRLVEAVTHPRYPGEHDPRTALGALRWKVWGEEFPAAAAWARSHPEAMVWAASHPERAAAILASGAAPPGLSDAAMAAMTAPSPASADVVAPPPPSLLPAAAPEPSPPVTTASQAQVAAAPEPTVQVQTPTVSTDEAGTRTFQTQVTTRAPGPNGGTTVVTVPIVVPIVLAQTGPTVSVPAASPRQPAIPAHALEVPADRAPQPAAFAPASRRYIQPRIPQGRYRVVRYEPSTGQRFEVRKPTPQALQAPRPAPARGWWY